MNRFRRIMFARDKDVYDLLRSNKVSVTVDNLRVYAARRGIFLSGDADLDHLIAYIASLPFDWTEIQRLAVVTNRAERQEASTTETVIASMSRLDVKNAIQSVADDRGVEKEEQYSIELTSDSKAYCISVTYDEYDFGRTLLRQCRAKTVRIFADVEKDEIRVRFPDNERACEIATALLASIVAKKPEEATRNALDLSELVSAGARTDFMMGVLKQLDDYTLDEVTNVRFRPMPDDDELEAEGNDEDEDEDEDEQNGETGDELDAGADATPQLRGALKEAVLKGTSLETIPEFQKLKDSDYYVSRLRWTATHSAGRSAEFQVGFRDQTGRDGLNYRIHRVQHLKKDKELGLTMRAPTDQEERALMHLVENAARASYTSTIGKAQG
jgi:hypothetical protein